MLPRCIILLVLCVCRSSQQSTSDPSTLHSSYDYIICGGGTAGLTVAQRLVENPEVSVLVVEAGKATDVENWNYPTGPAVYGAGVTQDLPAGKVLGGSSAINGRVYLRAEQTQINTWEKAGNPGWNWASLFEYYKKSETIAQPNEAQAKAGIAINADFHGTEGPLNTGWPTQIVGPQYFDLLKQTYPLLGIPVHSDPNGGDMHGLSTFPRTMRTINGSDAQETSRTAYYEPLMGSISNLDVLTESTVRRIVWATNSTEPGCVRANGVEISSGGRNIVVRANREVILAGGTYRSPSILEYSGVGNPSILTPLGIAVTVDLPGVGENLMDQTNNVLNFFNAPGLDTSPRSQAFVAFVNAQDIWGAEGAAAVARDVLADLPAYAARIAASNNGATSAKDLETLLRIQHEAMFAANMTILEILHGLSIHPDRLDCELWSSQPFSRGNVHITSREPPNGTDRPGLHINHNYFMLDYDIKAQAGGAKLIRKLFATAPLNGSMVVGEISPGLETVPWEDSDREWYVWLKARFRSAWHAVGSATMMPREMGGVVNANLTVYGTANVRIVDASVFTFQVNGHTSATVYAVAEKAADLIKADYYSSGGRR